MGPAQLLLDGGVHLTLGAGQEAAVSPHQGEVVQGDIDRLTRQDLDGPGRLAAATARGLGDVAGDVALHGGEDQRALVSAHFGGSRLH